jgi:hypothetical protein
MANVSSSTGNALFGVSMARVQQAKRNAEQAEARASALQAQARDARRAADRANDSARSAEADASTAKVGAMKAQQGYAMLVNVGQLGARIAMVADRVEEKRQPDVAATATPKAQTAPAATATKSVVNSQGQVTGRLVNTTA